MPTHAHREERKADIEYNKRQLLYHFEKAKVKPESDCEEQDEELELKGWANSLTIQAKMAF